MSHMTSNIQTLTKARKAARVTFALILFGGAIVALWGIYTNFFPVVLDGIVLGVSAIIPYFVSKIVEKKIQAIGK